MVTFSCDGCGEMMKKSQVDGHANRCRRCQSVSCVDCSVSFFGDEYRGHTTCTMTEVDNLVAARGQKNKKQTPQEAWMDLLHSSTAKAPPSLRSYLQRIVQLENVPRKEKQFRNFASNSLNFRGATAQKELDAIWNFLQQQREVLQKQREQHQSQQKKSKEQQSSTEPTKSEAPDVDGSGEAKENPHHGSGQVNSSSSKENNNDGGGAAVTYKTVKKATKKILKKAPGKSMKYKSLHRAVREQVIGGSKKELKAIVKQVVTTERKKFLLEGKHVKLVVSE